jgi:GNAT superfamily N-acetyltransferase
MEIRPAVVEDIPVLCGLLSYLFEQESEFEPDTALQEKGLKSIITNPDVGVILVIKKEAHVIGMVNLLYTVSTALGGRVAVLEDMIVEPAGRNTGAGSMLLKYALDYAKKDGCLRVTLLTDEINRDAQTFYSRHGFSKSAMIPMRIML